MNHTKKLLNEEWNQFDSSQQQYFKKWEKSIWPLVEQYDILLEAELTPDQIQNIFQKAETTANASDNNLTTFGKIGSVSTKTASLLQTELNKLADSAQNAKPIRDFDAQFIKLQRKIKASLNGKPYGKKILVSLDNWKKFATESPIKSTFIIGAMIAVLSFLSGGIVSGSVIGFFIRLANNLIKGDKLSSAVGKGVAGAAIGAAFGAFADILSSSQIDAIQSMELDDIDQLEQSFKDVNYSNALADTDPELVKVFDEFKGKGISHRSLIHQINGTQFNFDVYLNPEQADYVDKLDSELRSIKQKISDGFFTTSMEERDAIEKSQYLPKLAEKFAYLQQVQDSDTNALYRRAVDAWHQVQQSKELTDEQLTQIINKSDSLEDKIIALQDIAKKGSAGLQGLATAAERNKSKKESYNNLHLALLLSEGTFTDLLTRSKTFTKNLSKQLSNKVTLEKINTAWKKAGKPTDSHAIYKILIDAGLSDDDIVSISTELGVDLTANEDSDSNDTSTNDSTASDEEVTDPIQLLANEINKIPGLNTIVKDYINKSLQPKPEPTVNTDSFEVTKGQMRKLSSSGNKPIPPKMATEIQSDLAKLAKGDKESGIYAANKIFKLAKANVDISTLQQTWVANAKAGERFLTQSIYRQISKMLNEYNLTWRDLNLNIVLVEHSSINPIYRLTRIIH